MSSTTSPNISNESSFTKMESCSERSTNAAGASGNFCLYNFNRSDSCANAACRLPKKIKTTKCILFIRYASIKFKFNFFLALFIKYRLSIPEAHVIFLGKKYGAILIKLFNGSMQLVQFVHTFFHWLIARVKESVRSMIIA